MTIPRASPLRFSRRVNAALRTTFAAAPVFARYRSSTEPQRLVRHDDVWLSQPSSPWRKPHQARNIEDRVVDAITRLVKAEIRSLVVFADASVRGPEYRDQKTGERKRRKVGPATAACFGWVRFEATAKPVVEANAVLGRLGPNRAEYEAAILALEEAREYVAKQPVTHLLLCSDSATVINTLAHRWEAHALQPLRAKAREVQGQIEGMGVEVNYEWVPRSNPWHHEAHPLQTSPATGVEPVAPPRWSTRGLGSSLHGRLANRKVA